MSLSVSKPSVSQLPFGSITNVAGVTVGHHQRTGRGWQTGTTVLTVKNGATPGVDVRGGGPGTRETDAISPENLVGEIHGICLTGGSAYGLASAYGLMAWLEERGLGFPIGPRPQTGVQPVVPVVPAAVIFDLGRGGVFENRPDAAFGQRAAQNAKRAQNLWGSVGAGTGAKAGGLQGGVGTAATVVRIGGAPASTSIVPGAQAPAVPAIEVVVGALAVVNSVGSVINPRTALPWEPSGYRLKRPNKADRKALSDTFSAPDPGRLNTTIGVVATSARLSKSEVSKMASVSHDGLARAIRPAHSMFDGDTVFGLATGEAELSDISHRIGDGESRQVAFNLLLTAAADTFAAACTHAVLAATTIGDLQAYSDVCPSALP
jgi:L-aminopeptidase/D-esterase-like protein